jgi:hypothetical protein
LRGPRVTRLPRRRRARRPRREALTDALEKSAVADARRLEAFPGEVDLAPIVGTEQQVAVRQGVVTLLFEVGQAKRIPGRFGDLRLAKVDELVVKPERHPRTAQVGLALRDLVRVVDRDVVDASRMDVEALAQVLDAHRRALEVPAGSSLSPRRVPLHQAP